MRAVEPSGPYRLLGWSIGGVVAHEMAVAAPHPAVRISSGRSRPRRARASRRPAAPG
ncbi:thioesterase domain-containing protein [Streptomyces griseus]